MTQFLQVLAHVQTHLDEDLSLHSLAAQAKMSAFHFQRTFRAEIGETPRAHVERTRLERAALQLVLRDCPVVDIAVEHGFQSHEVFTRAFRRRFGASPSAWRTSWAARGAASRTGSRAPGVEQGLAGAALSSTKVHELHPVRVAFIRHTGPYDAVDVGAWRALAAWAARRGVAGGPLLGVAHDAPNLVDPKWMRFDACVVVPDAVVPPRAGSRIALTTLAGGTHAVTTFVGPLTQLEHAYRSILTRLLERKDLGVIGLPAIERYVSTEILSGALQRIEIALPVILSRKRRTRHKFGR